MPSRAELEVTSGGRRGGRKAAGGEPVRILVMADFSGSGSPLAAFSPRRVAFESLDDAVAAFAPRAPLDIEAPIAIRETLELRALEDFHPDALARRLDAFRTLRLLGQHLADPATHGAAAAQLAELTGGDAASSGEGETPRQPASEGDDELVARLLGSSAKARPASRARDKVQSFIDRVMASAPTETQPATTDVDRRQLVTLQEAAMRAVLLSQPLRSLERSWRSLDWLVRRLDDDVAEIHALDLSKAALASHLREHAGALDRSGLHKLFREPAAVDGWDIIVGDYAFDLDAGDLALLATIGAVAGQAGVPFLAQAGLGLCGCDALERIDEPADWHLDEALGRLWDEVRSHPAARSVALAAPRMLIRQPYGAATDPIDAFPFEELPPRPAHECFFWGNPAFGCAWLLAQARAGEGAITREIDDMPGVLYDDGTGQALKPPIEALLTERTINRMQASGLIAMVAHRNTNSIRCPCLTTLSKHDPPDLYGQHWRRQKGNRPLR